MCSRALCVLLLVAACQDPPRGPKNEATGAPQSTQAAFDKIYRQATWGRNDAGLGNSGTGSTAAATVEYRTLLQALLAEHKITSVVDAGCGDWEFSQSIDWTGIDYKGFDIVPAVVEQNRKRFGAPNIQFSVGNIVEDSLPDADLLICKHVLQHLPDKDVSAFLRQLPKYKYALITNGVDKKTLSATHATDIAPGGYRELDITKPPFSVKGTVVKTYSDGHHTHQIVLITR